MNEHEVSILTLKSIVAWVLLVLGSVTLHDILANIALISTICLTFYTLYKQIKGDKPKLPPGP